MLQKEAQKCVIKLWLQEKKIMAVIFLFSINMQLERNSGDNLVPFCDVLNCVKKMWLHGHVATLLAHHYSLISQRLVYQFNPFFHSVPVRS